MGKRNRDERAAAGSGGFFRRPDGPPDVEAAIRAAVVDGARSAAAGDPEQVAGFAGLLVELAGSLGARRVEQCAAGVVLDALRAAWAGGWQPADVPEITRRRLGGDHTALAVALVLEDAQQRAGVRLDPRWQDQLTALGPAPHRLPATTVLGHWAATREFPPPAAWGVLLELLGLLITIPRVPCLLPPPGSADAGKGYTVDARTAAALAKVRALLAKAESTEFPEEAEALSAKAQELMSRHSLSALLDQAGDGEPDPVGSLRIWLEAPYLSAKALLVGVVAQANRCRCVWSEELGFVTLVGDERDLLAAQLVSTSLLVQATRALLEHGRQPQAPGRPRSRSFRQSFLVAYANRIGDRLAETQSEVTAELVEPDLLPVLVADEARVQAATEELFPGLVERRVSIGSSHGWAAGLAAADRATLDARTRLAAS